MITELKGNLLESQCNILVNTVNCYGVMGKGIALQFKKRYPEMYKKYVSDCDSELYSPGDVNGYYEGDKIILNFATKNHWRSHSKYEWIEIGLKRLKAFLLESGHSIAIPALGCSNGQLDWEIVSKMIYNELGDLDNLIELYSPM